MLQKLFIKNYAIIEQAEVIFSDKLTIITGETGAGKSILIGALGLILGNRADSSVLQDVAEKCITEAVFDITKNDALKQLLQELDFDAENEIIIRREIAANGKSRAFLNDTPVNLTQLKQLTALLVDLHQQFDTLQIGDDQFQQEVIDALANNSAPLKEYQAVYANYVDVQKQLKKAREQQAAFNKELDYQKFLYSELEEAGFKENELEDAEAELKLLSNAEQIKAVLSKVYYQLDEGEQPVVQQIKTLGGQLQSIGAFHESIESLVQRLQSAHIELRDIADEVERLNDTTRLDEKRMELLNDRLSTGYKLLKKHGVQTTAELLATQTELEQKLQVFQNLDTNISTLEKNEAQLLLKARKLAQQLSDNRKKQVPSFEKKTNQLLSQVGMPNARLKVKLTDAELNATGADAIEFLFDANNSNRFEPLQKVASGGELSRLMLCVKSLVAASVHLPTLIFDEIDTGISGEAAKQVGIIMKNLGKSHQVISITHQPQIAAKADDHLFVYKKQVNSKINTHIRVLTQQERIDAIAQMLSGEKPTASAVENAREMMAAG